MPVVGERLVLDGAARCRPVWVGVLFTPMLWYQRMEMG